MTTKLHVKTGQKVVKLSVDTSKTVKDIVGEIQTGLGLEKDTPVRLYTNTGHLIPLGPNVIGNQEAEPYVLRVPTQSANLDQVVQTMEKDVKFITSKIEVSLLM